MLTIDTIPLRRKDAGTGRPGDTGKRQSPCLRVSLSPCLFFTWFLYEPCAYGNVDKTSKTQADQAWSSYSSSLRSCGSYSRYTGAQYYRVASYSATSEMVPAPTVRPPSRMANRNPFSIAMGVINSTSIVTLSPGITISTPSGKLATPVTSVVRK